MNYVICQAWKGWRRSELNSKISMLNEYKPRKSAHVFIGDISTFSDRKTPNVKKKKQP